MTKKLAKGVATSQSCPSSPAPGRTAAEVNPLPMIPGQSGPVFIGASEDGVSLRGGGRRGEEELLAYLETSKDWPVGHRSKPPKAPVTGKTSATAVGKTSAQGKATSKATGAKASASLTRQASFTSRNRT